MSLITSLYKRQTIHNINNEHSEIFKRFGSMNNTKKIQGVKFSEAEPSNTLLSLQYLTPFRSGALLSSALLKKCHLILHYLMICFSLIFNVVFYLLFISILSNCTHEISVHSKNFHPTICFLLLDIS